MGKESRIEWCDATWNPWYGCHKVSAGCKNCYMYRDMARTSFNPHIVTRAKDRTFFAPLEWKVPEKVFTCSWSDFFIEEADPWRADAWEIIKKTPMITYQILTKRPERIEHNLPFEFYLNGLPVNVWLGVSAENQEEFDARWPVLESVAHTLRATITFLSLEPLLGPIDMEGWLEETDLGDEDHQRWQVIPDWIITGGESGPEDKIRKADPQWFLDIQRQCQEAGIAFFHKQNGGSKKDPVHGAWGGRELNGKTYSEFPKTY
jgi:protein gp37